MAGGRTFGALPWSDSRVWNARIHDGRQRISNYAFKPIAEQALRPNQTVVPQRLNAALGIKVEDDLTLRFRSEIKPYLGAVRGELTGVLRKLIEFNYPDEVIALSFEVFTDSFTQQFPARVFFMDKDNNEFFLYVEGKAAYPSPVDPGLIAMKGIYPLEIEERYGEIDENFDAWDAAFEDFATLFLEAWGDAGGKGFCKQATIACHDSPMELNLISGKWQPSYSEFDS